MSDNVIKISLILCTLLLMILVAQSQVVSSTTSVRAQAPKTCVWTYIEDNDKPELGKEGKIELKGKWKKVSDEGWELKAAVKTGDSIYVFEKCN